MFWQPYEPILVRQNSVTLAQIVERAEPRLRVEMHGPQLTIVVEPNAESELRFSRLRVRVTSGGESRARVRAELIRSGEALDVGCRLAYNLTHNG